jgi:hypothetical protein
LDLAGQRALRKPGGPGGGGDSPVLRHQPQKMESMEVEQGSGIHAVMRSIHSIHEFPAISKER